MTEKRFNFGGGEIKIKQIIAMHKDSVFELRNRHFVTYCHKK